MNKKEWEKKIRHDFEKRLPDSGLNFETLSSEVDFEKYGKNKRKTFTWIPITASIAGTLAIGVGIAMGTLNVGYHGTPKPKGFEFGTYVFETIEFSKGSTSLPKPQAGDTFVVSNEAESDINFEIDDSIGGVFYLSIFGAASGYGMNAKETYPNMVIAEFDYEETLYTADFVLESRTAIRFTVSSVFASFSAIFTK